MSKSQKVYLVAGKRTPFGKFGGSLKDITPVDLSVIAAKEVLADTGLSPDQVDQVILGNVVPSSTDTMYGGRHLALKLGMPQKTPGMVVNRLCGSGIQSICDAARLIKLSEASCVLAGGTENMSMIPHLVYGSRFGTRFGELKTVDMLMDALTDKFTQTPMGITAENLAQKYELTRAECDEFSLNSHLKAAKAYREGLFKGELAVVEGKRGNTEQDEHLRPDCKLEDMTKLRPSFAKDGVVTPATASGIVDGAAICLVAGEDFVEKHGLKPMAEIIDYQVVGVDPTIMGIGPVPAIDQILRKNDLSVGDIDLVEINEAFAPQVISCSKELKLPAEKLNIWGGSIALGHPLAASGTRITVSLARQLVHTGGKMGIASACIGGGQGIAILLKI